MLYKIDDKFYIKVQGYYKSVDINVNGDNLDITPNGNEKIDADSIPNEKVSTYDTRISKNDIIKVLKKKDKEQEHELTSSPRTRQNNHNKRL